MSKTTELLLPYSLIASLKDSMNQPCPQQSNPQNLWEMQLGLELTRTIDCLHETGILYGRWSSATRVIFYGNLESHEGSRFVVVYPEDKSAQNLCHLICKG